MDGKRREGLNALHAASLFCAMMMWMAKAHNACQLKGVDNFCVSIFTVSDLTSAISDASSALNNATCTFSPLFWSSTLCGCCLCSYFLLSLL